MIKRSQLSRRQLACLGDASRFHLVRLLRARRLCVTELADEVGLSQSCTTRHLQALKQAGLVCAERRGKRVLYGLCSDEPRVATLLEWALRSGGGREPEPDEPRLAALDLPAESPRRVTTPLMGQAGSEALPDAPVSSPPVQSTEEVEAGAGHRPASRSNDLEDFLL
ncbi:MAG TPA: helix-turn-helix domain-containing protein [Candidatus Limnocylindria bacterium]|nr:helix-turn-helix domain-containing protein [Candidatus Limnocylindria bacterium]